MNALVRFLRRIPTLGGTFVATGALALGVFAGVNALPASAAGAPTATSIAPTFGVLVGGTAVTITGTGFVALATVTFDGVPATGVVVASATSITATAPAGTPGTIVARLSQEIGKVMTQSGMRERFNTGNITPSTPEGFAEHIKREIPKWRRVFEAARIEPE